MKRGLYSFMYPLFAAVVTNEDVDPNDFVQFRAEEAAEKAMKSFNLVLDTGSRTRMLAVSTIFVESSNRVLESVDSFELTRSEDVAQFVKDLRELEEDVRDETTSETITAVREYLENERDELPEDALPLASAVLYSAENLASAVVVPLFNPTAPERSAALILSPLVPGVALEDERAYAVSYPICKDVAVFDKKMNALAETPFYGLLSVASASSSGALESIIKQMEETVGNPKHKACGTLMAPIRIDEKQYTVIFSAAPLFLTEEQVKRLEIYVKLTSSLP